MRPKSSICLRHALHQPSRTRTAGLPLSFAISDLQIRDHISSHLVVVKSKTGVVLDQYKNHAAAFALSKSRFSRWRYYMHTIVGVEPSKELPTPGSEKPILLLCVKRHNHDLSAPYPNLPQKEKQNQNHQRKFLKRCPLSRGLAANWRDIVPYPPAPRPAHLVVVLFVFPFSFSLLDNYRVSLVSGYRSRTSFPVL